MKSMKVEKVTDTKLNISLLPYADGPCIVTVDPGDMMSGAKTPDGKIIPEHNRRPNEALEHAERYIDLLATHLKLPDGVEVEKRRGNDDEFQALGYASV